MWNKLIATDDSWAPFWVRVFLGLVIFPHGAQKLLGWFGGGGVGGTVDFFASTWGIPAILTYLVILAEFFGALALIVGFMTRFCAASVALVMAGAMFMVHLPNGFFMNWMGNQAGEGYEYHLLAIGMCLALLFAGGGRFSVDRALMKAH